MREIRTSGSMSGMQQIGPTYTIAPHLDSTQVLPLMP